jgi:hypothetical protein
MVSVTAQQRGERLGYRAVKPGGLDESEPVGLTVMHVDARQVDSVIES